VNQLIIYGAGGHAREVAQLVADINRQCPDRWELLGFIADAGAQARNPARLPAPHLGEPDGPNALPAHPDAWLVIAVGASRERRRIAQRLAQSYPGLRFATLVHPSAWLGERVTIGAGCVAFAGALLNVDVRIGAHASLNLGCTISHDGVLGDFVSLAPGVHLSGDVRLGDEVEVGTGAVFLPGVRVGPGAVVAAGAVVTSDVPPGQVAVGVPARAARPPNRG
jgi:sugar O-acyltransferase (sialic acid O-acetyltransferase NeuD family)